MNSSLAITSYHYEKDLFFPITSVSEYPPYYHMTGGISEVRISCCRKAAKSASRMRKYEALCSLLNHQNLNLLMNYYVCAVCCLCTFDIFLFIVCVDISQRKQQHFLVL